MVERRPNQPIAEKTQQEVQKGYNRPSLLRDEDIAFIQHAFARGADEKLDERTRLLIARNVNNPSLTQEQLSTFIGLTTQGTNQILKKGLQILWQASPPELQQRYPEDIINRDRRKHRLTEIEIEERKQKDRNNARSRYYKIQDREAPEEVRGYKKILTEEELKFKKEKISAYNRNYNRNYYKNVRKKKRQEEKRQVELKEQIQVFPEPSNQ